MELGSRFQVTLGNQNMTMNKEALWKGRKNRTEGSEGQSPTALRSFFGQCFPHWENEGIRQSQGLLVDN